MVQGQNAVFAPLAVCVKTVILACVSISRAVLPLCCGRQRALHFFKCSSLMALSEMFKYFYKGDMNECVICLVNIFSAVAVKATLRLHKTCCRRRSDV